MEAVTVKEENKAGFDFQGTHYYMDGYLRSNLEIVCKRVEKKWDTLLLFDGLEGAGKTTIAKTCGAFVAQRLKREFDSKKVFFDIDDLMHFAQTTRRQVILWDEAALGGMAQQWATQEQLKLKQLLITCRKYEHVLLFVIPDFTILGRYFSCHRSIALIRVYSPDFITRGYFRFYNFESKRLLYDQEKKGMYYNGIQPSFFGRFTENAGIMDEEDYEKRKDEAIQKIGQDKEKPDSKDFRKKLYILIDDMHQNHRISYKYIKDLIGFDENLITKSIQYYRKKGDIGDFEYKLGKKVKQFQMPEKEVKAE